MGYLEDADMLRVSGRGEPLEGHAPSGRVAADFCRAWHAATHGAGAVQARDTEGIIEAIEIGKNK